MHIDSDSISDSWVYVVDDDEDFRLAISALLQSCGLKVRSFPSASSYLAQPPSEPGCLVLDVNMPGLSGLILQTRIAEEGGNLPIIFLTGVGTVPMAVEALKSGAEDFLTKPVDRHILVAAINRAFQKEAERRSVRNAHTHLTELFARLTPRETEVCQHLVKGLLNKQVAFLLGTSERTIKAHRYQIQAKLEVQSMVEVSALYERLQRGAG